MYITTLKKTAYDNLNTDLRKHGRSWCHCLRLRVWLVALMVMAMPLSMQAQAVSDTLNLNVAQDSNSVHIIISGKDKQQIAEIAEALMNGKKHRRTDPQKELRKQQKRERRDSILVEQLRYPAVAAVKTNLLLDFAYMPGYDRWCPIPNLALEYYPQSGHLTYGASLDMPWWQDYDAHKYFQGRNWQAEVRYYTKGAKAPTGAYGENEVYNKKAYTGFYLQGYVHGTVFGICFDENRGWVGEGAGAGIGAGYVMPITRSGHWKLELGVQLGYFYCKYDPYQYENPVNPAFRDKLYYYKWSQKPEYFKKRQYRWNWLGPTRVGITLSYDLLYRKKNVRSAGVSLKKRE